jgi:tRNA dimethylallyltransferase
MAIFAETGVQFNLLVILGPTASGKTQVAVRVAQVLGGEIISADSRQVYRGMDIGTGKDLAEYRGIPYHLIDILDPGTEFSVFDFQRRFSDEFRRVRDQGKMPILVGGTGLYLEAVLRGYRLPEVPRDPDLRKKLEVLTDEELGARLRMSRVSLHNITDLTDRNRLIRAIEITEASQKNPSPTMDLAELSATVFGIKWDREALRRRITKRLKERLNGGMIEEVRNLHQAGLSFQQLDDYGLEYRYVGLYLRKVLNRNDLFQKLNSAIHQFAKRQETWFRRMERQGIVIHWVEGDKDPSAKILKTIQQTPAKS